jgi:hypothetical protein
MGSQWDYLLENLGEWQGSFTRLAPDGTLLEVTPSVVILEGLDNNTEIRQTIRYLSPNSPIDEKILRYRTVNRSVLFFESGAFSQGSMQWGPFSEFGAELGLKVGDRRLRLIESYDKASELNSLTLIRETRAGTTPDERPPLTVEQLVGVWQGKATTLCPDWRPPIEFATRLEVTRVDADTLRQCLGLGDYVLRSSARIEGSRLIFEESELPTQLLLLPDGGSAHCPIAIKPRQSFVLEVGWLIDPNHRQRLVRRYDATGAWVSLTLIQEEKVS